LPLTRHLSNHGGFHVAFRLCFAHDQGLLNDAADSVQDPSRDARQIVRELDDSIGRAENSLIEIEAQVATQRSKRDAADDKVKKYEDGAKRALQAGDEALARRRSPRRRTRKPSATRSRPS
jgi:phage shock protein A